MNLNENQKKILEVLRSIYPNSMDIDDLVRKTRISQSDMERELAYLQEKGIIETLGELGRRFIETRITSVGIDALADEKRDKILGELKEIEKAELEAKRRETVARYKLWGWMIELIDKRREKLKSGELPSIYELSLRAIDISNNVRAELASEFPETVLIASVIHSFNNLVNDLQRAFGKEYRQVHTFPTISTTSAWEVKTTLKFIDFWLGQMLAFLFARFQEISM